MTQQKTLRAIQSIKRKHHAGNAVVLMVGTLLTGLMTSAVAVDMSYLYAENTLLQSAADSAALAATHELVRNSGTSASAIRTAARGAASSTATSNSQGTQNRVRIDQNVDVTFGYLNPASPTYNAGTFSTTNNSTSYSFTGGYNAVRVNVRRTAGSPGGTLPSIMAKLFGVNLLSTQASAIALADNRVSNVTSGLRPFYACQAQWNRTMTDGNPSNNTVRIYGNNHTVDGATVSGCPSNPAGNWGFADFRDNRSGAPSNTVIARWIEQGYGSAAGENAVVVGQSYSTQPGNAISSNGVQTALDSLMGGQGCGNHEPATIITIPLVDSTSGSGSNASYHISQLTGFEITDYRATGSASSRYIEGHFTQSVCSNNCSTGTATGANGGGNFKIRLVR